MVATFIVMMLSIIVGDAIYYFIANRISHRHRWVCQMCKEQGKLFRFSSNDKEVTSRMATAHVVDFHTTLKEQGEP